jgi:hypothetical protein
MRRPSKDEALGAPAGGAQARAGEAEPRIMRSGMGPFEAADVAFIETLKARHETLKVQLAGVERAQDMPQRSPPNCRR